MYKEIGLFILSYLIIKSILWIRNRLKLYKTFENLGIPGPKPSLFSGHLFQIKFSENPSDIIEKWLKEYGNCFGYYFGERPFLVINDLDVIQQILITNSKIFHDRNPIAVDAKPFNDSVLFLPTKRWSHVRKMVTPAFSHNKLKGTKLTELIPSCVDKFLDIVDKDETKIIDIGDGMQLITLDIISQWSFDMKIDIYNKNDELVLAVKEYIKYADNIAIYFALMFSPLRTLLKFVNDNLTAGRLVDMIVKHLKIQIKNQINQLAKNHDESKSNMLVSFINYLRDGKITENELIGSALVILIAGYETTANGLTCTFYLLAKHQEIQDKLRQDILSNGTDSQYIDMVWNETLRLYPPAPTFVTRVASQDIMINDIFIPKDVTVQIPIWHIHHDENIWPEPYKFDPERFSPKNKLNYHSAAFLPFGLGPHTCLGMQFSYQEARIILHKVISKYRIEICDQTPNPLILNFHAEVMSPKDSVYLKFVPLN